MRLALASGFTLSLLLGLLFAVLGSISLVYTDLSFYAILGLVVLFNFLMWLVSPKISDFTYRFTHGLEWITLEELRDISPASAEVIEEVTEEYDYSTPKLGIIRDSNPQAFTYGSGRWNSRIVVTEGIFEYLDDNEASSVYAHELGHITNRDFIIMTIANTVVQTLFLIYINARRQAIRARDRKGAAFIGVAVAAYVFYFIGKYLVYYLSRVREYYADKFASEWTDPNYLSSALIKISYGILDSPDNKDLVQATESMGIMDLEQGEEKGAVYYNASNLGDWDALGKALMFDFKNPWASLLELTSTHPLTGKRIKAMNKYTDQPFIDFDKLLEKTEVSKSRLYKGFFKDLSVIGVPKIMFFTFPLIYGGLALANAVPVSIAVFLGGWALIVGFGAVMKAVYSYPMRGGFSKSNVMNLLGNIYSSPVKGEKTSIEGEIIGRGNAGYFAGSDLKIRDSTGMIHLGYTSLFGRLGNFFFGWRKAGDYVNQKITIKGWYFRGLVPRIDMHELGDKRSYPRTWSLIKGVILVFIGLVLVSVGLL